ncbi:MAG: monovalent cation/H+ antiporter subunit D family protein, partial [Candidatus Methanospirareceae archaeon]
MVVAVEHFPVIIVVSSLLSAYFIFISPWLKLNHPPYISIATLSIQLILSFFILVHVIEGDIIRYKFGGWSAPWGIEYVVDAFNAFVLLIILFLCFICAIYSVRGVEKELSGRKNFFYTIFQLFIAGLCGIILTGDIFNLYVFLEIASLSAYVLIAVAGGKSLRAAFNYLVMGTIGACFYLLGVAFLYAAAGTLNMMDLRLILHPPYNKMVLASFMFFTVGLSIKMAIFPLHTWQPDAYTYAPSAISAMMAGTMSKVSAYALIRIFFSVFSINFLSRSHFMPIISWIAATSIIFGSLLAIPQRNFKRMLAYSSVSQIGYVMLGVGLFQTRFGLQAAMMHILNHALMKCCLFLVAGAIIYKTGFWDIAEFKGLAKRMPFTSVAFVIAALSMIGIPPSVGFVTKLYLIAAALEAHQFVFMVVILLNSLLEIIYFWRVVELMYFKGGEEVEVMSDGIPLSMLFPTLILSALCIIIGILWLAEIPLPLINRAIEDLGVGASLE